MAETRAVGLVRIGRGSTGHVNPSPPLSPPEPLVGPRVVAEQLGMKISWVYTAAETGLLPSYKLGKYRKFRPSEVAAWLAEQRRGGA